jgi:hydroxypyruvate isomerase
MPRFAANLSMMYNEVEFLDRFALAARDGFSGVEFLFPYAFEAAEILDRLRENALDLALFNMPPGDWDAGERGMAILPDRQEEFVEGVEKALTYARALGGTRLHCMAGIAPADVTRSDMVRTYVHNLKHATTMARAAGIKILIEPINSRDMPGYFLNTTAQAIEIMEAVGADNLYLQYDVYHMQIMQGDLVPNFLKLKSRIGHVQIADTPGRHEPGTGEINYNFVLKAIDEAGYDGWVGCEYRPRAGTSAGLAWADRWLGPKGL